MRIEISGGSDDMVCVGGDFKEEYNVYSDTPYMGYLDIGGKVKVHCIYDGCWSFSVGQVIEDISIPADWPINIIKQGGRPYSTGLQIHTNEKVRILFVKGDE